MFIDYFLNILKVSAITQGIVCPRLVSRSEWGANAPKQTQNVTLPVGYVVIHHTYIPSACWSAQDCRKAMKTMQKMHQEDNGWFDIGYNFAVGGDGRAYVGRGWGREGAHAPPYNQNSVGITLIGDWREDAPSEKMLATTKLLIQCGVKLGYISPEYKLIGHEQAQTVTECPGTALFNEIKTWNHWAPQWIHPPATEAFEKRPKDAYSLSESSTGDSAIPDDASPTVIRIARSRLVRRHA